MPFKPGMRDPSGLHMYHATLPPIIVYSDEDEAKARKEGYSETYVMREPNLTAQQQAAEAAKAPAAEKEATQ